MPPEPAPPSITEQIQSKFKKPLLAAVAKLPKNSTLENQPQLLNEVMGDPSLECRQHPTYSIGPEAEVLLHYKLAGKPEIFQEHLAALLGDEWWSEGQTVSVTFFPEEGDDSDVRNLLKEHNERFLAALARYHTELSDARRLLRLDVGRALSQRALAESFLPPEGVKKEPAAEPPRFRPSPRKRGIL